MNPTIQLLTAILAETDPGTRIHTIIDALLYGYKSNRLPLIIETILHDETATRSFIARAAEEWNGSDYISGALYTCKQLAIKDAQQPAQEPQPAPVMVPGPGAPQYVIPGLEPDADTQLSLL